MAIESMSNMNTGQLREDGTLGPIEEVCILRAEKIFKIRSKLDTNPHIVQMVSREKPIEHWYYRSDQWIDQPYFALGIMKPYIGPANRAPRFMYGEGKFIITDKESI
jgi:hypothetical protein